MITQKRLKEVLDYDPETGIFTWKIKISDCINLGSIAGTKHNTGYIIIGIDNKNYLAHRLAWFYIYGKWPKKDIDHKDQIKHHNWKSNLRDKSHSFNLRNCGNHKHNKSGVKGVSYVKQSSNWRADININKKNTYLGSFDDFDGAVLARYKAERKANWHLSDPNSPAQEYCIEHCLIERPVWVKRKSI